MLLCLPFLLPPGVCVCRAERLPLRAVGQVTKRACPCCRPKPKPAETPAHSPACPAHEGWSVVLAVSHAVDAPAVCLDLVACADPVVDRGSPASFDYHPDLISPPSQGCTILRC